MLQRAAALLGSIFAIYFARTAWRSIHTRAPTWVDGPVLDIMEAFRSGRLYQISGLKTMPYTVLTHTPLSYAIDYGLYRLWPGFSVLRLVNVIATIACAALIFSWVHRRTKTAAAPVFAACAFLSMPPVFQWSQVARSPDSFCCFFSLAALMALENPSRRRNILLGALFTLAFFSKQTAALILLPTLIIADYRERRSAGMILGWLAVSVAIITPICLWLQWSTRGGFWLNVVEANSCCAFSLGLFIHLIRILIFFWIFAGLAFALSGKNRTPAHVWAIVSIGVGLLTCGKLGADTMYFFDGSAAIALLSGLAIDRGANKAAIALMIALFPCLMFSDVSIARTSSLAVEESYRAMMVDLRPYPTILSDEASIDINSGRPWYWGDPLVLGQLEQDGKWNASFIESGLATHRFAAVVVWSPYAWSQTQLDILHHQYHLWRTYTAFKGSYHAYLPNSPGGSR